MPSSITRATNHRSLRIANSTVVIATASWRHLDGLLARCGQRPGTPRLRSHATQLARGADALRFRDAEGRRQLLLYFTTVLISLSYTWRGGVSILILPHIIVAAVGPGGFFPHLMLPQDE